MIRWIILTALVLMMINSTAWAQSTTSTSLEGSTATQVKKPSPWGVSAQWLTEYNVNEINRGESNNEATEHFVGVNYKLNKTRSLGVRQYFFTDRADGDTDFQSFSTALVYADSALAKVGNENLYGQLRLYTPTGDTTREDGTWQLRGYAIWETGLAKATTLELLTSPRLFAYTESSTDSRKGAQFLNLAYVHYKFNDYLRPFAGAGFLNSMYRNGTDNTGPNHSDDFLVDVGLKSSLTKNLQLEAAMNQFRDYRRSNSYQLLDEDDTVYRLSFSASM